jgi:hypothetical protein
MHEVISIRASERILNADVMPIHARFHGAGSKLTDVGTAATPPESPVTVE